MVRASVHFLALATLLLAILGAATGCNSTKKPASTADAPAIIVNSLIGSTEQKISAAIKTANLPDNINRIELELDFGSAKIQQPEISVNSDAPAGTTATIQLVADNSYRISLISSEAPLGNGELANISIQAPRWPVPRRALNIRNAVLQKVDGTVVTPKVEAPAFAVSLISDPVRLAAFLAGIVALIYLLAQMSALQKFFSYLPPLIWMYFVPMMTTTIGITPDASTLYSPFFSRILLPAILILLLIPSDIAGLRKLGGKALLMMLIATTGIVAGAIGSFWLFTTFFPGSLPEGTWKGVAGIAGSWIGGSPNMFAVIETLQTPAVIIGPVVIVDTVCAYTWLGILIALVPYQHKLDKRHRADTRAIEEISARLSMEQQSHARAPRVADIAFMLGLALVASQLCLWFGSAYIFPFFDKTLEWKWLSPVMSGYGWSILLITAVGLILSTTGARKLDYCGASSIGYVGLYFLLTGYGAQANLRAILEVPVFMGIGVVWIIVHIAFLYIGMRVLRAPLFLASTSSMANIGGTASAPVVAAAYNQSMAPVGLLMAILGGVLGTPLALFVVALACKAIAGE